MDKVVAGRRVIIGWNQEPGRWFGREQEILFTAYFLGPVLVGIGKRKKGRAPYG